MTSQPGTTSSHSYSIPLINFSDFLHGPPSLRLSTASSLLDALQTTGFIYLTHHPIPAPLLAHTFSASASFFALPQPAKDALRWTSPRSNRGYVAPGREKVSSLTDKADIQALKARAPDLKESFEIGREGVAGLPNHWPAEGPEFKTAMLDFFARCAALHREVMRAIAVGMGLEEAYFDRFTDGGDNTLRLLHYPPVRSDVFRRDALQVRAGEHTDYGSITLLFQDARGGLQVKTPEGRFVDVTPVPGSVVVNAGDLLARWSNDSIRSTVHRVVEPPPPLAPLEVEEHGGCENRTEMYPARYSIAYFCNPNFDKWIEAIEGTFGGEKGVKKYPGINAGEYLEQRLAATY